MNIRPYLFVITVDVQTSNKKCIIALLLLFLTLDDNTYEMPMNKN